MKVRMVLCALTLLAPGYGGADGGYFWVGLHSSQYRFTSSSPEVPHRRQWLPGIDFGYRLAPRWSVQGGWGRASLDGPAPPDPEYMEAATVSLRRHFGLAGTRWTPYAGLAGAELVFEAEADAGTSEGLVGAELGAQRFLFGHWYVDLGVRRLRAAQRGEWDTVLYAGLNLALVPDPPDRPLAGSPARRRHPATDATGVNGNPNPLPSAAEPHLDPEA